MQKGDKGLLWFQRFRPDGRPEPHATRGENGEILILDGDGWAASFKNGAWQPGILFFHEQVAEFSPVQDRDEVCSLYNEARAALGERVEDERWREASRAYTAALGAFIVQFNLVDEQLADTIKTVLAREGRKDLAQACQSWDFSLKTLALDLLKISPAIPGLEGVPIALLEEIARAKSDLVARTPRWNASAEEWEKRTQKLDQLTRKGHQAWCDLAIVDVTSATGPPQS